MIVICDIIIGWDVNPDDEKVVITKGELKEILKSTLNPYYKNGYTNTADSIEKSLIKEVDYQQRCRKFGKDYVPLSKDNNYERNESFTFTINAHGEKEYE